MDFTLLLLVHGKNKGSRNFDSLFVSKKNLHVNFFPGDNIATKITQQSIIFILEEQRHVCIYSVSNYFSWYQQLSPHLTSYC